MKGKDGAAGTGSASPGTPASGPAFDRDFLERLEACLDPRGTQRSVLRRALDAVRENRRDAFRLLAAEKGFLAFLKARGKGSPRRFEGLLELLLDRVNQFIDPRVVARSAVLFSKKEYRATERQFFMRKPEFELCRGFDAACMAVVEQKPDRIEDFLSFFRDEAYPSLNATYAPANGVLPELMRRLVGRYLAVPDSRDLAALARRFCEPSLASLVLYADAKGEAEAILRTVFHALESVCERDLFFSLLGAVAERYEKKPELAYERTLQAWDYFLAAGKADARRFKDFLQAYGKAEDPFQTFLWNLTFRLKPEHQLKTVTLFASPAFRDVLSRYGMEKKVLKLLIRNILAVIAEAELPEFSASLFPIVLKLLLTLKVESSFLKRRADLMEWLKTRTGSLRVELAVIRLLFYEYIFLSTGVVPNARVVEMTKFADDTHKLFCRVVDGAYKNALRQRSKEPASRFAPLLPVLRDFAWRETDAKFQNERRRLAELRDVAESLGLEDAVLDALDETEPGELVHYHAALLRVFRTAPDLTAEAATADYWYRLPFERASGHIHSAVWTVLGAVPVVPSEQGACTNGLEIRLPRYFADFRVPAETLENNGNLTLYVGCAYHEAAHILGGTFIVDLSLFANGLEKPHLFRLVHNVVEDHRVERFLVGLDFDPRIRIILKEINRYSFLKGLAQRPWNALHYLMSLLQTADGVDEEIKSSPVYLEFAEFLDSLKVPTGRFGTLDAMTDYFASRMRGMDERNPFGAALLALELYHVLIHWPDPMLEVFARDQYGPGTGAGDGAESRGSAQPLSRSDLEKMYKRMNEKPDAFLDGPNLEVLKAAYEKGSTAEAAKGVSESLGLGDENLLREDDAGDFEEPDYGKTGTIDKSRRTAADKLSAARQKKGAGRKGKGMGAKRKQGPKKKHVYSVDSKTGSRTRLSEIAEYQVDRVDRAYLARFSRWSYIEAKIQASMARILPQVKPVREDSLVEGDLNVEAVVDFLARKNPVGQAEFLEDWRDEGGRDFDAIIGIDCSGSTASVVGDGGETILDVEKAFALLFGRALQSLGGRVECLAFNSLSSTNVYRMSRLECVTSLISDNGNRDGDFIRYATSLLGKSRGIRYFFLLSDGIPSSPNYEGKDALNDTVIAMREAVRDGVRLIYLNVDVGLKDYFGLFRAEATYAEHFRKPEDILPAIPALIKTVARAIA